ncbi:PV83 orf 27-like protein [Staphylococcus aureus]|nr:PV83 orf 27-like protein [Staphylococcus aureus]VDZ13754.1 PV83 orf 27-like protein [Staphylococcus aureus]
MTFTLSDEQYKNLCTNSNKLLDKLHKALKDREEYKKQRDELIGDIAKLRDCNKELEKKASAWDRYCKSVEKDLINEFGNDDERVKFGMELNNKILWRKTLMNNREQIEQSVISASAYNGNDTEGLLKEIEDVYKKAQAFDEILEGLPNAMQDALKEDIYLDEAVGIMTSQVVYKYEEEQEND